MLERLPTDYLETHEAGYEMVRLSESQKDILQNLQATEGTSYVHETMLPEVLEPIFLRALANLRLPFEVSIVERDGAGVVAAGEMDSYGIPNAGSQAIIERHIYGRISLHTHVSQDEPGLCPSLADIETLGLKRIYAGNRDPAVIVNSYGVLVFGFNPEYEELETREQSPGKYSWGLKNRCKFKWEELQREIQKGKTTEAGLQEFYEFLEKEKVIKFRKTWEDISTNDLNFIFDKNRPL